MLHSFFIRLKHVLKKKYENNDLDRHITNIFDYNWVIRERLDYDKKVKLSNDYYGYNYILKRYSAYKGTINCSSEHAPGLEIVNTSDFQDKTTPFLIVNSSQRVSFLKGLCNKPIFAIGPSICYAKNIYSDFDIKVIKKNLGKTLCVYTLHNIEDTNYLDDAEKFIEYVNCVKDKYGYKTVLVSMYFVDIERGRHLIYERAGWIVVSAGRRRNYDFNDCMKTIISISDYAIFQSYASTVGYCIYMGVPVTIYPERKLCEYRDEGIMDDPTISDNILAKFNAMFEGYSETISKEQYDFCSYWYGYEDVLQPEVMKKLFEFCEKISTHTTLSEMKKIVQKNKYSICRELVLKALE